MDLICTLSTTDDDPALVERWLTYYRGEGVRRVHVFWNRAPQQAAAEAALGELLDAADITVVDAYEGVLPEATRVERFSDYSAEALGDRRVVLVADSDEFVRAPRLAAERMVAHGFDYVMGTFVDRFGFDGRTPAPEPGVRLTETFPVAAHFTYEALGAARTKVPLARPGVRYGPGCHRAIGEGLRRPEWTLPVDHFKWRAGIIPRIRGRLERSFGGDTYLKECRRLLDDYVLAEDQLDLSGITRWLEPGLY